MYEKYAIFTDLDGTFFNSQSRVPAENREAVAEFVKNGGIFGVSTGRAPENAEPFLTGVPINGWSVVLNGAAAYHFGTRQFLPGDSLDPEAAAKILRWTQHNFPQVNIQVCTDQAMYFLTGEPYIDRVFWDLHREMKPAALEEILQTHWLKILLCCQKPVLETVREYARKEGLLSGMDWVYSSPEYLEFLPKGASKGSCVRKLAAMPELQGRTVICIGDFYNDLELVRQADVGVAVANAVPELKSAADVIGCTNDENSAAWIVRELIPRLEENPVFFKEEP